MNVLELDWETPDQANESFKKRLVPFVGPHLRDGRAVHITVRLRKDGKSRLQEKKLHAMLRDIAEQTDLMGKQLPAESWKRVLLDAFKHETKADPQFVNEWIKFGDIELVPALNHPGFVMVGEQTRRFSSKLASGFIEWLLAFGAERNVVWRDPKWQAQNAEYLGEGA